MGHDWKNIMITHDSIKHELTTISYYKIEGLAWCSEKADIKINAILTDSNGTELASILANRYVEDLSGRQRIDDGYYGFVFYGLLQGVSSIVFAYEDIRVIQKLHIEQPQMHDEVKDYGFCVYHPNDYLFKFSMNLEGLESSIYSYIRGGKHIAEEVKKICSEYFNDKEKPYDLLDFASGYGRVTRGLDKQFFNVTASDIHAEAMEYISKNIGVSTFLSTTNPDNFATDMSFDIVFAFSFFSHMPKITFGKWITALYKLIRPGGLLVFTTHGRINKANCSIRVKNGYGFAPASEQEDLNTSDYGVTISELSYVVKVLESQIGQSPVLFQEGATISGGYQDLYVVRKLEFVSPWKNLRFVERLKIFTSRYRVLRMMKNLLKKVFMLCNLFIGAKH
jgi:2-polyprenyl-3-methyl-5-hydroxy-6-metoxy-1,4-benzoquinol methylase